MPLILDDAEVETLLSGDANDADKLMKPNPVERMKLYLVSTVVNNARKWREVRRGG